MVFTAWRVPVICGVVLSLQASVVPTSQAAPFSSCAQAEAAGAAPIYAGQPGYSRKLDRDGDGVACESGSGGAYLPAMPFIPAPAQTAPPVVSTPVAEPVPARDTATPTETCTDWMKLRINPVTGEEQVCGPIGSPATILYWIPPQPMPGGVHPAGSPCVGVPNYTFGRSTDDYQVWCAYGVGLLMPGGGKLDSPQPVWVLYSP